MVDRIGLCNQALTGLGNLPLQGEDAFGAEEVLLVFDRVVLAVLSAKRWRFIRRTAWLVREDATPAGGYWSYQYLLPGDRIGLPDAVWDNTEQRHFDKFEYDDGKIVTNAEALWAKYPRLVPFDDWPVDVLDCLLTAAQAELALAVNEDAALRQSLRAEVWGDPRRPGQTGKIQDAATTESQAEPGPEIFGPGAGGPFVAARMT